MIYLDNASTTKPNKITMDWLCQYDSFFGNPSNIYSIGMRTHELIEKARDKVAKAIGADPEDIYFTSGTSESNALAMNQGRITICSPYEHHSMLACPKAHVNREYEDEHGKYTILSIYKNYARQGLYDGNVIYSHMLVNNEVGTIYNIKNEFEGCHQYKGFLTHTDATPAIGNIFVDVKQLDADMLSLSGHKFHAPKGIGVLYINHNKIPREEINPIIYGSQENNIRGGTENFLGAICLGDCIEEATNNIIKKSKHCQLLKYIVLNKLVDSGLDYIINSPENSIHSIINFSLKNIEAEVIASVLSDKEIYIGTGSACNTGNPKPSYVLQTMGVPEEFIRGAIRLSFDLDTTTEDVIIAMDEIIKTYKELKGENN